MKEQLQELERWGGDVVFGRAKGFRAAITRLLMSGLAVAFRGLVQLRLSLFRNGWKKQSNLGTQVVSVGNITVGGTGKTPVVELLARSLRDQGRHVAILSRGYKSRKLDEAQKWRDGNGQSIPEEKMPKVVSSGGELFLSSNFAGDEPYMLAKNLNGISVVVDKNRVKGGKFAIRHLLADTLLLDDGMQYLKLSRGLNIVLVDSSAPFGTGSLLPRGTLREPPKNLKRAHYIMLTKCDGSSNEELIEQIRKHNRTAEIIECTHGPVHLENVFSGERLALKTLQEKWVGAISAIAVPEAFETALQKLGARVEITRRFSDHHRFSRRDVDKFMQRCVERDMEMVLTTEKDAVRFPRPTSLDVPIYFLRIEVKILAGQAIWNDMIEKLSDPYAAKEHLLRNREAFVY